MPVRGESFYSIKHLIPEPCIIESSHVNGLPVLQSQSWGREENEYLAEPGFDMHHILHNSFYILASNHEDQLFWELNFPESANSEAEKKLLEKIEVI